MTPPRLPPVYLLTCPHRRALAAQTLASFARTDWGAEPRVHVDDRPEDDSAPWGSVLRSARIVSAFRDIVTSALREPGVPGDWLLFLEDDVEFHPRLGSLVASWEPLADPRCQLASLFNPSLIATAAWGEKPRAFAADPKMFLGAQALLLRRGWAAEAIARWDSVSGMQAQRLAQLIPADSPIWVHKPSLVQHVAPDSGWGARVQRALDFDPAAEIAM